jgi:metallo-beta-lactamase class B
MFKRFALLTTILFASYFAKAQHPEWSAPNEPFRIAGNLYYVGTYDLACYLIVTPAGSILINTGLSTEADMLTKNIKSLGFEPKDIRVLLTTQAHFDHLGAMASIQRLTGARMMVDRGDSAVVADGGKSDQIIDNKFDPVKISRVLADKDTIQLGGMVLQLLHHPGHTKGSCSYIFNVRDEQRSYRVLIANMPTIVTSKKFSEVTSYPNISSDYAYTLREMKKLKFDLWVASHASQFDLHSKRKPGDKYNPSVFMDKKAYDAQIKELNVEYLKNK